jgi:peptidoglycan/xylan/chitin deacetylase (PgdA/CDA1 family)
MRHGLFSAGVALSLALSCGAAWSQSASTTADSRLAYFQTKNIFHSGLRETHTVALTFDDGPNANTPAVLDALKANGVKATFFIVGRMAKAYPQILARIAMEGHLLANHSATHPMLGRKYIDHPEMLLDQIRQVDDEIAPLMPAGTKFYFRAPYGSWRAPHADALNADPVLKKYVGPIYWDEGGDVEMSSDGYVLSAADWDCWHRKWDADTCAKGYMREIRRNDGGVVLMHCIHSQSAALVAAVIPALQQEGYTFVRIDQVPAYQKFETQPTAPAATAVIATSGDPGAGVATAAR